MQLCWVLYWPKKAVKEVEKIPRKSKTASKKLAGTKLLALLEELADSPQKQGYGI
ncbi:MAG: hypothetical protein EBE86_018210 [Hormoscilla sp. GUM202]|nr:hypothetical protein [Hormoscilla sp. GUM202]